MPKPYKNEGALTEQALIAADLGRAQAVTEDGEIINTVTHEVIARPPPFFKTPWNHDTDAESNAHAVSHMEESKTQQQFAKDADINEILRKFMNTGELPKGPAAPPQYMDIPEEFDLQNQMVTAHQVQEAWQQLPAAIRATLTPATFCDYVDHCVETGDLDPLRELGLAKAKETPKEPETPKPAAPPQPKAEEQQKTPSEGVKT